MDNQINSLMGRNEAFSKWLFEVCSFYSKEPHNTYNSVNLTDAKLAFLSGMSSQEYSKEI